VLPKGGGFVLPLVENGFDPEGANGLGVIAGGGGAEDISVCVGAIGTGSEASTTGIGAVGTALVGLAFLHEPATAGRLACLVLIVAGIVGLKLLTPA